jgi:hypothetical protein
MYMKAAEMEKKLEILEKTIHLDLTVNDLRIIVGCFNAISYMMQVDDEPYLDLDGLELRERLRSAYAEVMEKLADAFA